MATKKVTTKDINDVLRQVLGIEPIIEYVEPMPEVTQEMRHGQAQIYANDGFRKYMLNEINRAVKNAALFADNEIQGAMMKGRLITLKELLGKSERSFHELEKFKTLKSNATEKGEEDSSA